MTRKTRSFSKIRTLAAAAVLAAPALASAQNVTIVYPIDGGAYPISDPAPGPLNSSYFTASFSVTCGGGPHVVEWGFGADVIGSARFYDQISEQQVWKLPGGVHSFWVNAGRTCGGKLVKFEIGS